jgi:hypothetical protein
MKSLPLIGAIAALAAGASSFAQSAPATTASSAGLLGQRYASVAFSAVDLNRLPFDQFGTTAGVNLPLTSSLDLGVSYTHSWIESFSDVDSDVLAADLTTYFSSGAIKPFGTFALAYDWNNFDDGMLWGVRAGFEYDVSSRLSTSISAGYVDDFDDGDNSQWDGAVRANYWVTRSVAAVATVSLIEQGNVAYSLGATIRF